MKAMAYQAKEDADAEVESITCGFCGTQLDPQDKVCAGCLETYLVNQKFKKESVRFLTMTLIFTGTWAIIALFLHLDLPTSLSVGLLVAIAGMIFGLLYCDAKEEPLASFDLPDTKATQKAKPF